MLTEELQNMTGNVLIAAAYLSYLGAFTAGYRKELIQAWLQRCFNLKIPASSAFEYDHLLLILCGIVGKIFLIHLCRFPA